MILFSLPLYPHLYSVSSSSAQTAQKLWREKDIFKHLYAEASLKIVWIFFLLASGIYCSPLWASFWLTFLSVPPLLPGLLRLALFKRLSGNHSSDNGKVEKSNFHRFSSLMLKISVSVRLFNVYQSGWWTSLIAIMPVICHMSSLTHKRVMVLMKFQLMQAFVIIKHNGFFHFLTSFALSKLPLQSKNSSRTQQADDFLLH